MATVALCDVTYHSTYLYLYVGRCTMWRKEILQVLCFECLQSVEEHQLS